MDAILKSPFRVAIEQPAAGPVDPRSARRRIESHRLATLGISLCASSVRALRQRRKAYDKIERMGVFGESATNSMMIDARRLFRNVSSSSSGRTYALTERSSRGSTRSQPKKTQFMDGCCMAEQRGSRLTRMRQGS